MSSSDSQNAAMAQPAAHAGDAAHVAEQATPQPAAGAGGASNQPTQTTSLPEAAAGDAGEAAALTAVADPGGAADTPAPGTAQVDAASGSEADADTPSGTGPLSAALERALTECDDHAKKQAAAAHAALGLGGALAQALAHFGAQSASASAAGGEDDAIGVDMEVTIFEDPEAVEPAAAEPVAEDRALQIPPKKKYYYKNVADPDWWEAHDPKTGKPYFWHCVTREARWKRPTIRVRRDDLEAKLNSKRKRVERSDGAIMQGSEDDEWEKESEEGSDEEFRPVSAAWKPKGESNRERRVDRNVKTTKSTNGVDKVLLDSGLRIIKKVRTCKQCLPLVPLASVCWLVFVHAYMRACACTLLSVCNTTARFHL